MADKIKCPNCGHIFDIEEALSERLEEKIKSEYEKKLDAQLQKVNEDKRRLEEERKKIEEAKEKQDEILKEELNKLLAKEKAKIKNSLLEEYQLEIEELRKENETKKRENRELKQKELALLQKETELKEKEEDLQLHVQKKLMKERSKIEEKAREKEREEFELEKVKLLKQIEDNKKLAEEMKRKAEQGSMQLQGEVQEIALENLLKNTYPFDVVDEVPKGVRGADCIQTVINSMQQECGSIVYESKRTKSFANDWIDKLKQDQITCKADIAVIVTQTMPNDMERFGEKDGVWICGFHEVRSLSFVLREMLIKTHSVRKSEENKGEKMELLYNYLTSNEFVQNVKRIVEIYNNMLEQLNTEKRAMAKIWKQREKQIWGVQENLSALFGSIKGIAGKELDTVDALELPGGDSE
jgi:hypothetical protein